MKLTLPKVYLIGCTGVIPQGLTEYLTDTGQLEFVNDWEKAKKAGISEGEMLCSLYAKLCYASLVVGKNKNISRVRDIENNIMGAFDHGHGSVFAHCHLNFIANNVSRVETHEHIRNAVGNDFSQESGRYVRRPILEFVQDPILEPWANFIGETLKLIEDKYNHLCEMMKIDEVKDFELKKKLTSAARSILPEGIATTLGFSMNIRSLRHFVMMRSSRHAEWQIRLVTEQIYNLTKSKFPLLYYGAHEEVVDGILEITGMKMQPY